MPKTETQKAQRASVFLQNPQGPEGVTEEGPVQRFRVKAKQKHSCITFPFFWGHDQLS